MSGDMSDEDFDAMLKEIDKPVAAEPAPAAPARRGKKTQTVVTDDAVDPQPALAAKVKAAQAVDTKPAEDDGFVKIAGLANQQPEPVTVTVVEDTPKREQYISPQTRAEMEAGRAVLSRFN